MPPFLARDTIVESESDSNNAIGIASWSSVVAPQARDTIVESESDSNKY